MKKDEKNNAVSFAEITPKPQIATPEYSELYKKVYLENDTGVSGEYCRNTTAWD